MEDSVNTHAIHTTDVLFSYYIVENIIHGTNEMERMLVSNSSSFFDDDDDLYQKDFQRK
jgi:hypothetical protein